MKTVAKLLILFTLLTTPVFGQGVPSQWSYSWQGNNAQALYPGQVSIPQLGTQDCLGTEAGVIQAGTCGGANTNVSFTNIAALQAATISATVQTVITAGYYTAGDGGGTTYARVGSEPTNSCYQQSADGAYWKPLASSSFNALVCGAYGDGSHDDGTAINDALTYCNAYGGGVVQLPQTAVGIYLVNSQINTGSCILNGTGGGKVATSANAVILRAGSSFPISTALVRIFDATRGGVTNLVVDCNKVAGCAEIQYASDDNPISTHGVFEHLTLQNGSIGFLCGAYNQLMSVSSVSLNGLTATFTTSSTLPWASGLSVYSDVVGVTPAAYNYANGLITITGAHTFTHTYAASPGAYTSGGYLIDGNEADQAILNDLIIAGSTSITNAQGIFVGSQNCFQQTTVSHVFNQSLWIWVNLTAGGEATFDNFDGGSFNASGGYAFLIGAYWSGKYVIKNSETEGPTGGGSGQIAYAVNDSSRTSPVGGGGPSVLSSNDFNAGNVLITSNSIVTSENNSLPNTNSIQGSAVVCTIHDINTTWSPSPSCHLP